eukprot:2153908-Amphidinium_carterae.1
MLARAPAVGGGALGALAINLARQLIQPTAVYPETLLYQGPAVRLNPPTVEGTEEPLYEPWLWRFLTEAERRLGLSQYQSIPGSGGCSGNKDWSEQNFEHDMLRKGAITRGSCLLITGGGYQWAGVYVARTEHRFHVILPAAAAYLHEQYTKAEGIPDASGELMMDVIGVCLSRSLVRSLKIHPGYLADPAGFWLAEDRVPFLLAEEAEDGAAWPSIDEAIARLGMAAWAGEEEDFQEPVEEEENEIETETVAEAAPPAISLAVPNMGAGRGRGIPI